MAHAVDTTLTLSGQIMPTACTLTMANGGSFDYGEFILPASGKTVMPAQDSSLDVACAGPTLFAYTMTDNRAGTTPAGASSQALGLGLDQDQNPIGIYTFTMPPDSVVDGTGGRIGWSSNNGNSWANSGGTETGRGLGFWYTLSRSGLSGTPVPVTTGRFNMTLTSTIEPKANLDQTREIRIDGSSTFTLIYL
ncbi:hypothetical protein D3C85_1124190 [compost metagenome]